MGREKQGQWPGGSSRTYSTAVTVRWQVVKLGTCPGTEPELSTRLAGLRVDAGCDGARYSIMSG